MNRQESYCKFFGLQIERFLNAIKLRDLQERLLGNVRFEVYVHVQLYVSSIATRVFSNFH